MYVYICVRRSFAIVAPFNMVFPCRNLSPTTFIIIQSVGIIDANMPTFVLSDIALLATVVHAASVAIIFILLVSTGFLFAAGNVRWRPHRPQLIRHFRWVHLDNEEFTRC